VSRSILACAAILACLAVPASAGGEQQPVFRDGDRIVLLGNTLIEREQEYGHWEASLILAHRDMSLQFRNLGWSGDTVWAESRGMFDPPAAGYQRMLELVRELKPTVIVFGYGGVEAFSGEEGLPRFVEQYRKLVDDVSTDGVRRIHLSPLKMEERSLPVQTPQALAHAEEYNANVDLYAEAIEKIAGERKDRFIHLAQFRTLSSGPPWTENGIHLSDEGYAHTGELLARLLGGSERRPVVSERDLKELRETVVEKNRLFFHRWRPQNFTYLFGFRKHEQGQNAVEIARFDPLIAAAEEKIDEIRNRIQ
jgi:lysophospholipase L1-like esterase